MSALRQQFLQFYVSTLFTKKDPSKYSEYSGAS